jgi:isopenicillin-N epimerase
MTASPHRAHWDLDPAVTFLNHGSFGATPRAIREEQQAWQARLEAEPVRFLHRELEGHLDHARRALAAFLRADAEGISFVPNATTGVNTVLQRIPLAPGDEVLCTDQEYNASRNALVFAAERAGARVVVVPVPFPIDGPEPVIGSILAGVSERTRLVLIDHVTSQTGMILPVPELVAALDARGIDTLVDGAHAPGQLDLDLTALGAAYYTGNCHKWLCTPKGSAFLHVRADRRDLIRPLVISHGANATRTDRSRFRIEHDWIGTLDPSAWLCIPAAIAFMGSLFEGGWDGLRAHNHDLVVRGRELLLDALDVEAPCPESMLGSLASIPLPDGKGTEVSPLGLDPLHTALFEREGIEVPVMPWPHPPHRLVRISAQAYNDVRQYETLAAALPRHLRA